MISQGEEKPSEADTATLQQFSYFRFRFTLDLAACEESEIPDSFFAALDDLDEGRLVDMEVALRDDPAQSDQSKS